MCHLGMSNSVANESETELNDNSKGLDEENFDECVAGESRTKFSHGCEDDKAYRSERKTDRVEKQLEVKHERSIIRNGQHSTICGNDTRGKDGLVTASDDAVLQEQDMDGDDQCSACTDHDAEDVYLHDTDSNSVEEDSDELYELETPTGSTHENLQDELVSYASHRFIGPYLRSDKKWSRALHDIRYLDLLGKPPSFKSELSNVEIRRLSIISSDSDRTEILCPSAVSINTYKVTFQEKKLGFKTKLFLEEEEELVVEVSDIDIGGPAYRAGIIVGDVLCSINNQAIENDMDEDEIHDLLQTASTPRIMIFRRMVDVEDAEVDEEFNEDQERHTIVKKTFASGPLFGKLSSVVSKGKARMESALQRRKMAIHPNTFCDGCGMEPIKGTLWTCSVCEYLDLCDSCYGLGSHGFEYTKDADVLTQAIIEYKLLKKCKRFTPAFMNSLRNDICKGRPEKMEYMGNWLADIINGVSPSKIRVRGLEVAYIQPKSRQNFVALLMPLLTNRSDMEVNMEWLIDSDNAELGLEKVRIWISDRKTRTESPFSDRIPAKA